MRIDQLALLFALVIVANLVLLLALQMPRLGRRSGAASEAADDLTSAGGGALDSADADWERPLRALLASSQALPAALYRRMTRVVSFMFIASALAITVLTTGQDQTSILVLLAFGLIVIELFQDVLPATALGSLRVPVEAAAALLFVTVLVGMTGGHASPFFFGYILLVGAAALTASRITSALLASASSLAYVVAVALASGDSPLTTEDLGRVAFDLIAIALVMYVASVIGREQRRAREEALRLSRFDSLTTLHSRDYFLSVLEQEIQRASRTGRSFAIAMLDLDGLKAANDRFGHEWGDNLLRAVADVLRGDIRVTDTAARHGGDEFVLLLTETDLDGAILVAEKVRVDISRVALPHNGAVVRTSVSIGIVTFPDDGRASTELMRRADLAMYEAKRRGRDQIVRFAREVSPATTRSSEASDGQQHESAPASATAARSPSAYPITRAGAAVGPGKMPVTGRAEAVPPASPGAAPWEVRSDPRR